MKENIFENNFKIRYSEMDCNLYLKPSSLLQLFQDVASVDAQNQNFGYSFLTEKKLAWFLLKYHIEFLEYPKEIYNLTIKTQSRGYNKLFAFRDFEIYNQEKLLAKATTTWGLINLETKTMSIMTDVFSDNPNISLFEKRENDLKYNKIATLSKIDNQKIFEVRYDDLDVNQHVNNSNYIIWALEPLEKKYRENKKLKTIDMVFKKETTYGSKVVSEVEIKENLTIHKIKNHQTDEDLCLLQIEWE